MADPGVHIAIRVNNLAACKAGVTLALNSLLSKAAYGLRDDVVQEMREPKSGLLHPSRANIGGRFRRSRAQAARERASGLHQASAPGEAPAIDTGQLINSLQVTTTEPLRKIISIGPHGLELEYGTAKIAPRPFMLPAAIRTAEQLTEGLTAAGFEASMGVI